MLWVGRQRDQAVSFRYFSLRRFAIVQDTIDGTLNGVPDALPVCSGWKHSLKLSDLLMTTLSTYWPIPSSGPLLMLC